MTKDKRLWLLIGIVGIVSGMIYFWRKNQYKNATAIKKLSLIDKDKKIIVYNNVCNNVQNNFFITQNKSHTIGFWEKAKLFFENFEIARSACLIFVELIGLIIAYLNFL